MENERDEIIVFQQFDNTIDANIIKTKLDAYGIPCFLTEENLANLYPGQQHAFFQVRLHLFKHDLQEAQQILAEVNLFVEDDSMPVCPQCQSKKIERGFSRKLTDQFLAGLHVLFFGIFFPQRKINRCNDCQHEF
ncbi:putative signal transducing protein [Ohtaekwangia sp.]|uniref:putative signal transducing protein n=1 Tax=Ohtaekwangia sp. TaxID=2066019 RepID=UPI002F9239D5